MEKLYDWLDDEPSSMRMVGLCFVGALLLVGWSLGLCYCILTVDESFFVAKKPLGITIMSLKCLFVLVGAGVFEEVLFRLLPLAVALRTWGLSGKTMLVALGTSILFAFAHGGIQHLLFQGVGGMLFSLVFLKCGGARDRLLKATGASSTTHILFNATLFAIGYAFGVRTL